MTTPEPTGPTTARKTTHSCTITVQVPVGLTPSRLRTYLNRAAVDAGEELAQRVIAERYDVEAWAEACKQQLLERGDSSHQQNLPTLDDFPVTSGDTGGYSIKTIKFFDAVEHLGTLSDGVFFKKGRFLRCVRKATGRDGAPVEVAIVVPLGDDSPEALESGLSAAVDVWKDTASRAGYTF